MYVACSILYEKFLPQSVFTSASFLHRFHLWAVEVAVSLVALSSLIYQFSALFYSKKMLPMDSPWQALHGWLHEVQIKLDKSKQAQMQGATIESVYWFHEGWKFVHEKPLYENFYIWN